MKRRMIATEIVSEGRFLRMSLTAQALYMHLLANADDDGCVDAYTITRMIGAKEDDLVLLKEREYITILDEKEYILWITGWQDFNWIDPRLKEDSKWLPLLRARIEGLEIIESTKKEANKRRYAKLKLERQLKKNDDPHDDHMMIHSELSRRSTHDPRPRIGKERLVKINTSPTPSGQGGLEKSVEKPAVTEEQEELLSLWKQVIGTTIYKERPANARSASKVEMMVGGLEKLKETLMAVRMIRADKYQPRKLQACLTNFLGLEKCLEQVEAYMQGMTDGKVMGTKKVNTYS